MADGSDSEAPVLVVVRHEKGVLSWQVSCLNVNDLHAITVLPRGSPFGDLGPHGDLFQILGPQTTKLKQLASSS